MFKKRDNCESVNLECMSLQIFFSRTTAPEMPIFTQKLVYIVKILNCKNRDPRTKTGAPGGVQSLTYIEIHRKMFKKSSSQEPLHQECQYLHKSLYTK